MRICRLDLLRYGCFTDVQLDLPARTPDFHIVFGANEAGKSTALSAIEDMLFGIPHNSPLNFVHDYASMRIGGVLQNEQELVEAVRRKGNRDTLLTPGGIPIPAGDAILARLLSGADRSFFARMFSLDHQRLRQGGREILEAHDEVGQMLFAVGAGITGLRNRLKALDEEAGTLWASRRAARRKYYQADDRLKAAENALRKHLVTAGAWQELRRAYESAQETYAALEAEIRGRSAELRKLSRIRRVYRDVRKRAKLETTILSLGEVASFPEDAREALETAERDDAKASARVETLKEQLDVVKGERAVLGCDEGLLVRADDINSLHEHRIQVRASLADLPKRRAELADAEADLRRLAAELEWEAGDIDELLARLPARPKVAVIRVLLNQRGELATALGNAGRAKEESEATLMEIRQQLDDHGLPVNVSNLAATIKATREMGDLGSRISARTEESQDAQVAIDRRLEVLNPAVADLETLAALPPPPRDTVQAARDDRRHLDQRRQLCEERMLAAEQELTRHQKARLRATRENDAVGPGELAQAREQRDDGWSLVRRRYLDCGSVSEDEIQTFTGPDIDLAHAYEATVVEADAIADRRFDHAEAAGQLAVVVRQIAEQEDLLEGLRREHELLDEESHGLDAASEELWAAAELAPRSLDAMLDWMTARGEILEMAERHATLERQAAAMRSQELEAKNGILAELERLGVDVGSLKTHPLRIVLEAASEVQLGHEKRRETRDKLEDVLRKAGRDSDRKSRELDDTESAWSAWQNQWVDALSSLELSALTAPEVVASQIDAIDEMREIAVKVSELRHERINKIERDFAAFTREAAEMVQNIAPDLVEVKPDEAILELERRLDEARRLRELRETKDQAIASLKEKVERCDESCRAARETIRRLRETAGVEGADELRAAIEKSDSLRGLQIELAQITATLAEQGEGLTVGELEGECDLVDIDQAIGREEALGLELQELRERLMEARDKRTESREAFEAIGGDDVYAKAAADRQAALAEMREVAEQYVRVRPAVLLLEWAIDRYRREKQAPLLERAGQLFATLTGGSFRDLRLDFDEDRMHLAGLRPDSRSVSVDGMSMGTADQLYLALRVASVEDYLDRATPLPFIADDLFVNFDDERAAAGFEVLGQLAQKTQVLFFTHHRHLVDIARARLGSSVSAVSLSEPTAPLRFEATSMP